MIWLHDGSARDRRRSAVVLLSILFACVLGDHPASGQTVLEVVGGRVDFPEGAPVLIAVRVSNRGNQSVNDVAPLDPSYGYLQFSLLNMATGRAVRPTTWVEAPLPIAGGGLTLRRDETQCQIVDLIQWFGRHDNATGLPGLLGARSLHPGEYELTAYLIRSTGAVVDTANNVLRSEALRFIIKPLSQYAAEDSLTRAFLSGVTWAPKDAGTRMLYCEKWLPNFYGSAYLRLVYLSTGSRMTIIPLDPLLAGLEGSNVDPLQRAAVLSLRLQLERVGDNKKLEMIRSLRLRDTDAASSCVISSWSKRIREKRFYESKGP